MIPLTTQRHILLGAGGHARELLALGLVDPEAIVDNDETNHGLMFGGAPVVGGDAFLPNFAGLHAVVAIGNNQARSVAYSRCIRHGLIPVEQHLGEVSPLAVIGDDTIVHLDARVHHDAVIGKHAFIGPGAQVLGWAVVGDGALIGANAVVLPGHRIGAWAVVKAGGVG